MKTRVQELNNFSRFARFLPFSEASLKNGQAVAASAAHRPGHLFLTWVCHYPPYTQAKLRFSCCPGSRHSHLLIACVCVSRSVVSDSLRPHELQPARLPCPWNSPGKNTGVDCHSLLQGIFPTQGSNLGLLIAGRFFTV